MNGYSLFMDWDSDAGKTLEKGSFHKLESPVDQVGTCKGQAQYRWL